MSIDLRLGDCLEVMGTIPDASVDGIVTSPPYNLGASPHAPKSARARRGKAAGYRRWEWAGYSGNSDNLPESEYQDWQLSVLSECYRVCAAGASVFYIHKDRNWKGRSLSPRTWLERSPFCIRQQITWDRGSSIEHSGWYFYGVNEWVFWLTKGEKVSNLETLARWGTVWRMAPAFGTGHPATFPIPLAERCVLAASRKGGVVLDPFMGSGATGVACVNTGRSFVGIEKDPSYLALAEKRLAESQSAVA